MTPIENYEIAKAAMLDLTNDEQMPIQQRKNLLSDLIAHALYLKSVLL